MANSEHFPSSDQPWHSYGIAKTISLLETQSEKGLTEAAVELRRDHYGKNELQEGAKRSQWEILLDQFKNVMLLMLMAVAVISGILDIVRIYQGDTDQIIVPFKDTIAIFAIVILNGLLGYFQESRAEKALAALKRLAAPKVQVIRDRQRIEVDAVSLVPGDIFLLEAGTQLCVDGQLLSATNLQIRESALTGEAHAVMKMPASEGLVINTPLSDRTNMVFTGTEVIQGRGRAVVTATAMSTELGKIAQMLQDVKNEPTPLQQRMENLGNILVSSSLILVGCVIAIGTIAKGWGILQQLVETSLSMAVAVVPEGLPAVITVTLALGTQRMVKRHALIRKLPAVETLGSVNVICSDKTGTLTQNKMIVQELETFSHHLVIAAQSESSPANSADDLTELIRSKDHPDLAVLLLGTVLCNNAQLIPSLGNRGMLGDPTEGALLAIANQVGLEQETCQHYFPRMGEFPFSSERKRMSVIVAQGKDSPMLQGNALLNSPLFRDWPYWLLTKGSTEMILQNCQQVLTAQGLAGLTVENQQQILAANDRLAAQGLRVLGLAYKPLGQIPQSGTEQEQEQALIWLGLVGMWDAPRLEVKAAVAKCHDAGIRIVMITGDHRLTAATIAAQLGISDQYSRVMTGVELDQLSQADLEQEVESVTIFARVTPEHKLRIVRAWQNRDRFVAMTGDGVNDAPALKQADIGIAMGISGTDVSKEASDMVLLDDNFATIVAATEEGRVVYTNIRHFIRYILGSNIGEVITIAAAPILGLPSVPLSPLQILWMNLVTDGLPALALAVEPGDPEIMHHPPFSPKESIFARGLGFYILRIGLIFSVITITLMLWAYNDTANSNHPNAWKTMVFTTLCLAQMGHAIAARSNHRLTLEMNPLTNPYLWGSVVVTTVLQLMLIYVAPLRQFFDTDILTLPELLICLGFSSLIFLWVEMEKVVIRIYYFVIHRHN